MKVKSSRGIAMKLICCTALVVLSSAVAFSQATTVNITAASKSGSNTTYTYTTPITGPNLQIGKSIVITGMGNAANNGTFTITALPSATSFTVVNASGVTASSQTGTGTVFNVTSGALLTITDGSSVNINIYDSQIHSGVVQAVPPCSAADQIPTDAYVLQGGSATGCDPGDAFEVTDDNSSTSNQAFGKVDISGFHIATHYRSVPVVSISGAQKNGDGTTTYFYSHLRGDDIAPGETIAIGGFQPSDSANNGNFTINTLGFVAGSQFAVNNAGGITDTNQSATGTASVAVCNTSNTICASPDSGFLTVTNNTGSDFTGTISLTGASLSCGSANDSSTGTLAASGSVTLALGVKGGSGSPTPVDSSNCGGYNQPQRLTLNTNVTVSATFGDDGYTITPFSASGQQIDVLPVPVPSGFTESNTNPTPETSSLTFNPGTHFPGQKCIAYSDFSAAKNPVCVEFQIACIGISGACDNIIYTAEADYNIDGDSLPTGIGGPAFLGHHTVTCPDNGFDSNIFLSYTANPDPTKGSGGGTGSCYVATFDPTATAVTSATQQTFVGFQGISPPPTLNPVHPGSALSLNFTSTTSGLRLCTSVINSGPTCAATPALTTWAAFGTLAIDCTTGVPIVSLSKEKAAGNSNIQTISSTSTSTSYRFNWKVDKTAPLTGPGSCVVMIVQFSGGLFVFPADFHYVK